MNDFDGNLPEEIGMLENLEHLFVSSHQKQPNHMQLGDDVLQQRRVRQQPERQCLVSEQLAQARIAEPGVEQL